MGRFGIQLIPFLMLGIAVFTPLGFILVLKFKRLNNKLSVVLVDVLNT